MQLLSVVFPADAEGRGDSNARPGGDPSEGDVVGFRVQKAPLGA